MSCTVLRASATSDTSSRVRTRTGSTCGTVMFSPSGVSRMSVTASGNRWSAMSLAWRVRARSGRVIDRDTAHVSPTATTSVTIAIAT